MTAPVDVPFPPPSTDDEVVVALRRSPLLAGASSDDLGAIIREFAMRTADTGKALVEQGSLVGGFGFVVDGQVAVRTDGKEVTRLGPGEPFGEISALTDEPATAAVVALGPVRYLVLSRERVREFLTEHPYLCFTVLQGEARRLQAPNRWYSSRASHRPDQWSPGSWRTHPVVQQPPWPDERALGAVLDELRALPPLVFGGEAERLRGELAEAAAGRAFLLQAGDCAETFTDLTTAAVHNRLRVILQMALVLTYASGTRVAKVARMAGQFAKPRSSDVEMVDGVPLPVYRGDIVNAVEADPQARVPDPARVLTAYHHAAAKLNLIRSLTSGGFGGLSQIHAWNRAFVAASPVGGRYEAVADQIDQALQFMRASRMETGPEAERVEVWTSHEALLLDYEEALTRRDDLTGEWVDSSAHTVWVGERTRALDGAHIEFLSGIANPVGCKIGPTVTPDEAVALCERLNPMRQPGKLTLITRMGAARLGNSLPPLLAAVRNAGHPVLWACDPMHGNTVTTGSGRKTRHFDDVVAEVEAFFTACLRESVWPGGLHVELTGDDVTECLGGGESLNEDDLDMRYATTCDPRLNGRQSLDLAFRVAELLRAAR